MNSELYEYTLRNFRRMDSNFGKIVKVLKHQHSINKCMMIASLLLLANDYLYRADTKREIKELNLKIAELQQKECEQTEC